MPDIKPHQKLNMGWLDNIQGKYLVAAIGLIAVGYLVQTGSPLRLNSDSSRFLAMADSFIRMGAFIIPDHDAYFPTGYASFIVGLDYVGLANPFGLIFSNLLFLSVGLLALRGIASHLFPENRTLPVALCLITLLSVVFIKYAAAPQSEMIFFAFTLLALRTGLEIQGSLSRRLLFWVLFAALSGISIWLRMVGICLIPPLLAALYRLATNRPVYDLVKQISWAKAAIFGVILGVVGIIGLYQLLKDSTYWTQLFYGPLAHADDIARHSGLKLTVLFQILFNFPTRIIGYVPAIISMPFGLLFLLAIAIGLWARRKVFGILEIYTASYVGLLLIWPFFQPRLWLVVLPFLLIYAAIALGTLLPPRAFKFLAAGWAAGFAALGIIGLVYSASLSLDRASFPTRYGNGVLTDIYNSAYAGRCPKQTNRADFLIYKMLVRFEPFAIAPEKPCRSGE